MVHTQPIYMRDTTDIRDVFLAMDDAASFTGLSRDYLMRLCRKGAIYAKQDARKQWSVSKGSLGEFLETQQFLKDERRKTLSKQRLFEYHEQAAHNSGDLQGAGSVPRQREAVVEAPMCGAFPLSLRLVAPATAVTQPLYTPTYTITPAHEALQKSLAALCAFLCTFGVLAAIHPTPVVRGFASLGRSFQEQVRERLYDVRAFTASVSAAIRDGQ